MVASAVSTAAQSIGSVSFRSSNRRSPASVLLDDFLRRGPGWPWLGDGTVDPGTVAESGGSGTVAGAPIYADPGTYTVTVTATGGSAATILFRVQGNHVGLGKSGSFLGTYLAPNAMIEMDQGATLQGALYGQEVHLKKLASVTGQPALDLFVSLFLP